jgi:hypothetical protein
LILEAKGEAERLKNAIIQSRKIGSMISELANHYPTSIEECLIAIKNGTELTTNQYQNGIKDCQQRISELKSKEWPGIGRLSVLNGITNE